MMIFAALFTALMVVGAQIKVPIGPVPIVLSNMFVLLAGLVLGFRWGLASVGLYLLLGFIGLPIFASGGGPSYFAGPTGGYLVGFVPAVAIVGGLPRIGRPHPIKDILALVLASLVLYAIGVPWLRSAIEGMTWKAAFANGMTPFLLGDALKAAAAFAIVTALRQGTEDLIPTVSRYGSARFSGAAAEGQPPSTA